MHHLTPSFATLICTLAISCWGFPRQENCPGRQSHAQPDKSPITALELTNQCQSLLPISGQAELSCFSVWLCVSCWCFLVAVHSQSQPYRYHEDDVAALKQGYQDRCDAHTHTKRRHTTTRINLLLVTLKSLSIYSFHQRQRAFRVHHLFPR